MVLDQCAASGPEPRRDRSRTGSTAALDVNSRLHGAAVAAARLHGHRTGLEMAGLTGAEITPAPAVADGMHSATVSALGPGRQDHADDAPAAAAADPRMVSGDTVSIERTA